MDRTLEKIALAEELGISYYSNIKKEEIKNKEEYARKELVIKELTGMKFRPITHERIASMFPKWAFKRCDESWGHQIAASMVVLSLSGIFSIFMGITLDLIFHVLTNELMFGIVCTNAIVFVSGIHLYERVGKVEVAEMKLNNWQGEIPYGALLAVKEAKEFGIKGSQEYENYYNEKGLHAQRIVDVGYKIYYPKLQVKIKADPVITGMYKGVEVEIFAWDDRKVYE